MSALGRLTPRGSLSLRDYPVDAAWSPDGRTLLIGLADGSLVLVQLAALQEPSYLPAHEQGVLALAWHKGGKAWASSGQDGRVLLWDARAQTSRVLHQSPQWSERLAFAERGAALAVSTGRTVRVFDEAGALYYEHASPSGAIAALAWHPRSGELASAGNGGALLHRPEVRDGAASAPRALPLRAACVCIVFHPEGRLLAAGLQEGSVQLWNLAAGSDSRLEGYGTRVLAAEWSGKGRFLATVAGTAVVLWDFAGRNLPSGEPLRLTAHTERVTAMACRPGGNWLASAGRDRRLLWWRAGAGDTPQDAHLLADECSLLRFTRDGSHLAVGDASGKLSIYQCEP